MKNAFILAALATIADAASAEEQSLSPWTDCDAFKDFSGPEALKEFAIQSIETHGLIYAIAMIEFAKGCGFDAGNFKKAAIGRLLSELSESDMDAIEFLKRSVLKSYWDTEFSLDLRKAATRLDNAGFSRQQTSQAILYAGYDAASNVAKLELTGLLLYRSLDSSADDSLWNCESLYEGRSAYKFEEIYYKKALPFGLPSAITFLEAAMKCGAKKCGFPIDRPYDTLQNLKKQVSHLTRGYWIAGEEEAPSDIAMRILGNLGFDERHASEIAARISDEDPARLAFEAFKAATLYADILIQNEETPVELQDFLPQTASEVDESSAVLHPLYRESYGTIIAGMKALESDD